MGNTDVRCASGVSTCLLRRHILVRYLAIIILFHFSTLFEFLKKKNPHSIPTILDSPPCMSYAMRHQALRGDMRRFRGPHLHAHESPFAADSGDALLPGTRAARDRRVYLLAASASRTARSSASLLR